MSCLHTHARLVGAVAAWHCMPPATGMFVVHTGLQWVAELLAEGSLCQVITGKACVSTQRFVRQLKAAFSGPTCPHTLCNFARTCGKESATEYTRSQALIACEHEQ